MRAERILRGIIVVSSRTPADSCLKIGVHYIDKHDAITDKWSQLRCIIIAIIMIIIIYFHRHYSLGLCEYVGVPHLYSRTAVNVTFPVRVWSSLPYTVYYIRNHELSWNITNYVLIKSQTHQVTKGTSNTVHFTGLDDRPGHHHPQTLFNKDANNENNLHIVLNVLQRYYEILTRSV